MNRNIIDADGATVEKMLRALIEKHGKAAVLAELDNLADMTGLDDWQRVFNIAKNVGNRIEREKACRLRALPRSSERRRYDVPEGRPGHRGENCEICGKSDVHAVACYKKGCTHPQVVRRCWAHFKR